MADNPDAPVSYKDPYWTQVANAAGDKLGLPPGLLGAIVTRGERTNADQVSSAGAKTPFQIIPATRDAALKKYGVDAYLSPENAAEVSGRLLKDSLTRNNGNVQKAVAEYIGGTDQSNWGPVTRSYVQRVTGSPLATSAPSPSPASTQSTFDRVMANMQSQQATNSIANVYAAYKNGQMTPQEQSDFEQDVQAGKVMLPQGASLQQPAQADSSADQAAAGGSVPPGVLQAFARGQMTPQEMADFESDVRSGNLKLPQGMDQNALFGEPDKPQGILDKLASIPAALHEAITGDQRRTATTDALPDWAGMPEMNQASMASFKSALGTLTSNPAETVQILQSNFPGIQAAQDENGNYILTSPTNGQQYAIKPGFRLSDIPRALGGAGAFLLANEVLPGSGVRGLAGNVAREAAVGATGQAGLEATKASTGGTADLSNIPTAAALGGVAPIVGAAARGIATPAQAMLAKVRGIDVPPTTASVADAASGAAAPVADSGAATAAPAADATAMPAAVDPVVAAQAAPAVAPVQSAAPSQSVEEIAKTAMKATEGKKSATADLAAAAAPDPETMAAAERLGITDFLQPDHTTASDAFRQVMGVIKSNPTSQLALAQKEGLEQVGKKAAGLIDEIGGTSDLSDLSGNVKSEMTQAHKDASALEDKAWQQLRDAVPAKTPTAAPETLDFLKQRLDDLGGDVQSLTPMERDIMRRASPTANDLPTFARVDDLRKDVGAAARQAGPFSDADTGLAKKYYSLLTKDQEAAVGPENAELVQQAKAATSVRKGMEDDLTSLFGKNVDGSIVPQLRGAMRSATQGDSSKIVKLLGAVPPSLKQQVVAGGMQTFFRNAATRGDLDFSGYAKLYEGLLRNKQSYAAIMNNLPEGAAQKLSDLYKVSRGISDSLNARISTGLRSSVLEELKGAPDTLAGRLFDVAKHAGKGLAADAVGGHGAGLAMGVFSALKGTAKPNAIKALDELLTSPEFLNLARSQKTPGEPKAIKEFALSKAFNKFSAAVGKAPELSNRERFVLNALQESHANGGENARH